MSKVLTKKQEKELFKKIADGNKYARKELIQANKFLVEKVAKKYLCNSKGLSLAKLKNLGTKGLLKAIEKYDSRKGYRFSTYALWWIRQAIHLELGIEDNEK